MLRYDKAVKRLERRWRQEAVLDQLRRQEPAAVYAGCLEYAIRSGSEKARGYASHLFKDVFGDWPRPCDRGPPSPLLNFWIDEWAMLRPKKRATNGRHG
jgi:hypothetical protein